jgi:hypothetical protein
MGHFGRILLYFSVIELVKSHKKLCVSNLNKNEAKCIIKKGATTIAFNDQGK